MLRRVVASRVAVIDVVEVLTFVGCCWSCACSARARVALDVIFLAFVVVVCAVLRSLPHPSSLSFIPSALGRRFLS